ncbi:hypothetical protein L7F22_009446 [Adiantum nelumboides]|nr:hypothetical protein [Adiantum nelumboides]
MRKKVRRSKLQSKKTSLVSISETQNLPEASSQCLGTSSSNTLPGGPPSQEVLLPGSDRCPKNAPPHALPANSEYLSSSLGIHATFEDDQMQRDNPRAAYQILATEGESENKFKTCMLTDETCTVSQPQFKVISESKNNSKCPGESTSLDETYTGGCILDTSLKGVQERPGDSHVEYCSQELIQIRASKGDEESADVPKCEAELCRTKRRCKSQASEKSTCGFDAIGIDLQEEQEKMFHLPTNSSQSFQLTQEDKFFLNKDLLHKKVISIAKSWGLLSVNEDVELCLSMSLEEWFRSIFYKLIRFSYKDDREILVTSNVGEQICMLRERARKALEAEELARQKETEDPGNKKIVDDMQSFQIDRVTAGNIFFLLAMHGCKNTENINILSRNQSAIQANEGMLIKWEIMAELGRMDRERKAGIQGQQQGTAQIFHTQADYGRPADSVPHHEKATTHEEAQTPIVAKDLISVLENAACMAKSTLFYRYLNKVDLLH